MIRNHTTVSTFEQRQMRISIKFIIVYIKPILWHSVLDWKFYLISYCWDNNHIYAIQYKPVAYLKNDILFVKQQLSVIIHICGI